MVHWPLRWVPLQKPSNNLSVYPNLLPSDWGQVEIWNLIRHILGFNLFSLSQVQVKHHISCLPNGFWQPGVRNFSWDSVNKPGFMLEMHKCTLSRMASTHCWRSLSLQIEMQVSLRHFLCFPGIAQSQLLQKISRLARSASTGPPPARGARAGQGRVGTSTVWSLFDCAFAHFRWRWSSFMYLILVKSITFFALNMSSPLCPRDLKLQLAARSASGIQECLAKDLKINCWIFQKQKRRKSTSPAICRKWEKCFIYHCLSTSAPPVKATPRPQKKLQSEDVKIDEWLGSNLYAHTNHLFKDSIKSDHTISLFDVRKVVLHISWATSASWLSSEICGKKIGDLPKVWTRVKLFTTLLVRPKTSKVLIFQRLFVGESNHTAMPAGTALADKRASSSGPSSIWGNIRSSETWEAWSSLHRDPRLAFPRIVNRVYCSKLVARTKHQIDLILTEVSIY